MVVAYQCIVFLWLGDVAMIRIVAGFETVVGFLVSGVEVGEER